jgi:tRNA threonylcarbamoyladenosine biosynthesis protein TsaE
VVEPSTPKASSTVSLSATTSSAAATRAFASALAARLVTPLVLRLEGPLGAGKTSFVQGFVQGLPGGATLVVQSPTYALMRSHATQPPVHHLDLYRLHEAGGDPHDSLEALGILDAIDDGFTLVEWPGTVTWPIACGDIRITPLSARRRRIDVTIPTAHVRA